MLAYWRYLQNGALPGVHDLYDEAVVGSVEEHFSDALALQQAAVSNIDLHVYDTERLGQGTLVLAETLPEDSLKAEWSFFLERERDGWTLVYDTFTAGALAYYVQQEVQRRVDPDAESPSDEAIEAADGVVAEYREAALESSGGRALDAPDGSR